MNSLILCKLPILFSAVKLKTLETFPSSSIDSKSRFLSGVLNFFQFMKIGFLNISLCYTSKFFPIHYIVGKLRFLKSLWFHILLNCEDSVPGKEGDPICQFLGKRNARICLYKNFVSVLVLEILFPSLNEWKNCKIFWGYDSLQTPNCIWNKPNLFTNALLFSNFSQYGIFSQQIFSLERNWKFLLCFFPWRNLV